MQWSNIILKADVRDTTFFDGNIKVLE